MKAAVIETRLGGRWYELAEDGTQTNVGRIVVWDSPERFVMTWHINSQWKADTAISSEVEVNFIPDGANATRVELEHRKFDEMGPEAGQSMRKDVDGGWPRMLERFKNEAEATLIVPRGDPERLSQLRQEPVMTIELYVFPPSPRVFKVMAVANHLGIDWTLHPVDLIKGEQKSGEFAALNPNMRMPVLKDGSYVLWESNAIGQYLAGKNAESRLLPADERGRLDVTRWQFWDLAHWDPPCSIFMFENVIKPAVLKIGEPDPEAITKGSESFHRAAKVLDGQLKGKKFVTGENLTLADFCLGAMMNLADKARYPVESYREIKRWHATLLALPAWQKTLAQSAFPAAAAA